MTTRAGFIVQNAAAVGADLDIAEPDAIDFNIVGNPRYGVISGMVVTVTGSSWVVNVSNGVYINNDLPVAGGGQVTLPTASQDLRFDLIVGDGSGNISAIVGAASPNPVFPDLPDGYTVFAAVLVKPGIMPQPDDVTDKRVLVRTRFTTAVATSPLLRNVDPGTLATLFNLAHDGLMTWTGVSNSHPTLGPDPALVATLLLTGGLKVTGALLAAALQATTLTATGKLVGSNFSEGAVNPSAAGAMGDLYKNTVDGTVWVWQGVWNQVSTAVIPPGMTMTSMLASAPLGWLKLDGSTVTQAQSGGLWNALPQFRTGPDAYTLPDATGCFFAQGTPGVKGGNITPFLTLGTNNMPSHHHLVSPTTGAGGSHGHTASMTPAGSHGHNTQALQGAHTHDLYDPTHVHPPYPDSSGGPPAIPMRVFAAPSGFQLGNQPIILAPSTGAAATGIAVTTTGSNHIHSTDLQGQHTHTITVDQGGSSHTHPITESDVGGGQPIDVRPPFMGFFVYIKT
jgi:hypothetical protein